MLVKLRKMKIFQFSCTLKKMKGIVRREREKEEGDTDERKREERDQEDESERNNQWDT